MEIKETITLLKNRGYRITPQRVAILKILKDNPDHPGVEEVFRSVIHLHPNISMATVYNVMELFEREGIIKSVALINNSRRYDPNLVPHEHFICESCERVFDVPDIAKGEFAQKHLSRLSELKEMEGFEIESIEITYRGFCKYCKDNNQPD